MALMRDGLWQIVAGTEEAPDATREADKYAKYCGRKERALATIVLSVDPSLLYLLGEPEDPVAVWEKLARQFQRKTWANKLELRRRLYATRLQDGGSVQQHIKEMTELFESLAVIGDAITEEDRVVHLLASLPDTFDMLVTALEANSDNVPAMENVTERLLREEQKLKGKGAGGDGKALSATKESSEKKQGNCHYCKKPGHFKRECKAFAHAQLKKSKSGQHSANQAAEQEKETSSTEAMVAGHALSATTRKDWIVDSGATSHMCNSKELFKELNELVPPQQVAVGDGRTVDAKGEGTVPMEMLMPNGTANGCDLVKVLYVPELAYNLLSVPRATEAGKTVKFDKTSCEFVNKKNQRVAFATKVGGLYHLEFCQQPRQSLNLVKDKGKEKLWHRRFGHLNKQSLEKLAKKGLIDNFDYNTSNELGFCKACVGGKQCRSSFKASETETKEPLELVHSDVCGKMNHKSIGGAEYILTFVDDKTHYSWVYPLKTKDEVFERFLEWKALVENFSGKKLKRLRTDNGGEYTSKRFEVHLKSCGIQHEKTIPKTPEQNGVAERLNRTLVESSRSMLLDAELPQRYWAEAVSTAIYLRNRCPTTAVKEMTPFEAWYGRKPRVGHLRVFGCEAYAHIPKDERGKFDSKTKKCILVGYGELRKGYRLYDADRRKILYSRDVHFNEVEKETTPVAENDGEDSHTLVDLLHGSDPETTDDKQDEETAEATPVLRRSTRVRRQYRPFESTNL